MRLLGGAARVRLLAPHTRSLVLVTPSPERARPRCRFQKLPAASNGKFLRCLVVFFSLHMAKHGPDLLFDQLERVQVFRRRRRRREHTATGREGLAATPRALPGACARG